jgi:hypothetical protein
VRRRRRRRRRRKGHCLRGSRWGNSSRRGNSMYV